MHIRCYLWQRHSKRLIKSWSSKHNWSDYFNLTTAIPLFCRFIVNSNPLLRKSWKINTSSRPEISHQHQMRYISSIFMICRNLATYKWNVFNVKIKIFSPVLTFSYQRCKFWASCRARYEANLAVFIVSFISNSIEYMWSILLLSFHLFSEMTSWI